MYSPTIDQLITALKKLPGVGVHAAERYVFHFLKSGKKEVAELTLALQNLMNNTQSCRVCWNFSDQNPCPICSDTKRDQKVICVVAEVQDLAILESTRAFSGRYHVLRGVLDATDEETLTKLKITDLFARLAAPHCPITEVLLALNPNHAGTATMMYLEKEIRQRTPHIKTSRLARGLPLGADLRYADELTLESAIKNRI